MSKEEKDDIKREGGAEGREVGGGDAKRMEAGREPNIINSLIGFVRENTPDAVKFLCILIILSPSPSLFPFSPLFLFLILTLIAHSLTHLPTCSLAHLLTFSLLILTSLTQARSLLSLLSSLLSSLLYF
jgi:hypothetical protein